MDARSSYDQLIEELVDMNNEILDLHENIVEIIKAGNSLKRVAILATGASVFWAGMYAREWWRVKKLSTNIINRATAEEEGAR